MKKKMSDNNLLVTHKKHSQFRKCEILEFQNFKICTFKNLEFENFRNVLPHINGV